MRNRVRFPNVVSLALLLSVVLAALPARGQSTGENFTLQVQRVGAGGGPASSTSFIDDAAMGQVTVGPSTSTSFRSGYGFIYPLDPSNEPLPVELTRFDATVAGEAVRLTWRTASETNNAGFEVERTIQRADEWTKVGFVEGQGTTGEPQRYRFEDANLPYKADSLSYRLKQIDVDGSIAYTEPTDVAIAPPDEVALRAPFPNPVTEQATIRYAVPDGTSARDLTLRLYDVLGRRVERIVGDAEAGRHEVQLSVENLSSGLYILRLAAGEQTRTQRLTVVK